MHSFPRHLDRFGLTLAAALAVGVVAPAAHAQGGSKQATAHINKANELYGAGDRKGSLVEFRRAYELAPNFRMLLNIARIELQVEDWGAAYKSFQRYLADGGSKVTPERRAEVEAEMKKLTAEHKDAVAGDGALYSPDPAPAPTPAPAAAPAPIETLPPPVAVTPPPKEPSREPSPAPPPSTTSIPWAGWAITGAFAIATGVSGALALGASSKYDEKLKTFGVTPSDLSDAQGSARSLVLVTAGLAAATAVSAGVTIYLQLSGKPGQSSEEKPRAASVKLLIGPGTLGAQGAF